ncbi:MAG: RrF2 family transcriptional regulator [Phycisphaerales bacterium]
MISSTARYALCAVIHLARRVERPVAAHEIAAATGVPFDYLSKVLHMLAHAGIVNGRRGPSGGFTLAKPADEMTLIEVVRAIDPASRASASDPAHVGCLGMTPALRKLLDEAAEASLRALSSTSVADVMEPDAAQLKPPARRRAG